MHEGLREHGRTLARETQAFADGSLDPAGFLRAFVPRYNHLIQHLNGHHQIEDTAYFPRFRALDPRMVAGFDLLEQDHGAIHEALLTSVRKAQGLVSALSAVADAPQRALDDYASAAQTLLDMLVRHLADEEDLVIPAILQHGERSIA